MTLTGYVNALSVRQGERIDCMVSATLDVVDVDVVRLVHGDDNVAGPGRKIEDVSEIDVVRVPGGLQDVHLGSCVVVPSIGSQSLAGLGFDLLIQPTLTSAGREQGIMSLLSETKVELTLVIAETGRLEVRGAAGLVLCGLDVAWRRETWYRVAVRVSSAAIAELDCAEVSDSASLASAVAVSTLPEGVIVTRAVLAAGDCTRAGRQWVPVHGFNGKLEHPVLRRAAGRMSEIVADWRFELGPEGTRCADVGGRERRGIVINAPLRAATGHNWTGREVDHTKTPEEYGAIHFHEDDLDDAGWEPALTLDIPAGLASGIYAVRLRAGDELDYIPFVVAPRQGGRRQRVAVLLPTFTYIAYANERMITRLDFEGDQMSDHPVHPGHADLLLAEHQEWGLSLYDLHSDGSTCSFSTHLRPIPNLRPDYRAWFQNAPRHLSADLYLIDWLTALGYTFDVITDHDVNHEGASLLEDYDVIITGSHPEYVSGRMLDSLEMHLERGGSLMYLGGNGFYWVTSQDQERPHLIEVRRGAVGTRPSEGAPGEGTHSTTGEPGGLWRQRGRWPNRLTGIGMASQGWDSKAPGYVRNQDGRGRVFDVVFAGIDDDEVIGDFGLIMNGASGDEIDRYDLDRGSPPETIVLASSTGHSDFYLLVGEDILASRAGIGGTETRDVRSDMTWIDKRAGGAVFSVGSICYTGALSHNFYDNNVSTVTRNALDEMLSRRGKAGSELPHA